MKKGSSMKSLIAAAVAFVAALMILPNAIDAAPRILLDHNAFEAVHVAKPRRNLQGGVLTTTYSASSTYQTPSEAGVGMLEWKWPEEEASPAETSEAETEDTGVGQEDEVASAEEEDSREITPAQEVVLEQPSTTTTSTEDTVDAVPETEPEFEELDAHVTVEEPAIEPLAVGPRPTSKGNNRSSKGPKGISDPTRAPTAGKIRSSKKTTGGNPTKPNKGSKSPALPSKGGAKGDSNSSKDSKGKTSKGEEPKTESPEQSDESTISLSEEGVNYVLERDATERKLTVAAFLFETESKKKPGHKEYVELEAATAKVFDQLYASAFRANPGFEYKGISIQKYEVLATRLVKYDISIYFNDSGDIPSVTHVNDLAQVGFGTGGEHLAIFLSDVQAMQSPVFSTTTAIHFINNEEELAATQTEARKDDGMSLAVIIAPIAAFVFLLGIFMTWYLCKHRKNKGGGCLIMEEADAIEVKHNSGHDEVIDGTEVSETYVSHFRSHFFPGQSSQMEHTEDYGLQDSESLASDDNELHEVSLEEQEVDMKTNVAEIRRSFIGRNIAELKPRRTEPVFTSTPSVETTSVPLATAVAVPEPRKPLPQAPREDTTKPSSIPREATRSPPPAIRPPPKSPPPRNVQEELQSFRKESLRRAPVSASGKKEVAKSPRNVQEELQSFRRETLRRAPDSTIDKKEASKSPPAWSTPALRKVRDHPEDCPPMKQRNLKRTVKLNMDGRASDDEQSILTIDSQSSATPEFLKRFKQMGLKRYKDSP